VARNNPDVSSNNPSPSLPRLDNVRLRLSRSQTPPPIEAFHLTTIRIVDARPMGDGDEDPHSVDHHNHALRIQTTNLPGQQQPPTQPTTSNGGSATTAQDTPTPNRVPSTRSFTSLTNDSYASSPILTPSGSTLLVPSTAVTPFPSPLVLGAPAFLSSVSPDNLILGPSARQRNRYSGLGTGPAAAEKRVTSEFVPSTGFERRERSLSSNLSGRTSTSSDGLRREEVHASRSRTSSVGDEVFVRLTTRKHPVDSRISSIGGRRRMSGFVILFDTSR